MTSLFFAYLVSTLRKKLLRDSSNIPCWNRKYIFIAGFGQLILNNIWSKYDFKLDACIWYCRNWKFPKSSLISILDHIRFYDLRFELLKRKYWSYWTTLLVLACSLNAKSQNRHPICLETHRTIKKLMISTGSMKISTSNTPLTPPPRKKD